MLHAEMASDERLVLRGVACSPRCWRSVQTPADQAIEQCERVAARAEGDRRTEAIVAGSLAPMYAMHCYRSRS